MAGVLWVMLRVVAPLATVMTLRVRRCIGGAAGGVDGEGVVGDGGCGGAAGGASGDCETGNAHCGVDDGRAAEGERCG